MKKTLLLVTTFMVASMGLSAQTVWNFGNDPTNFPVSTGIGTGPFPVIINGLSITGISTNANMGQVESAPKTFTDANGVNYSFANRFKFNGAGYAGATATDATPTSTMPSQRYLSFSVSGNSTIYMIGITGSSSSDRKVFVTDGAQLVGAVSFPAATSPNEGTITYTGPAAILYVFCNASCNLYYLSATNVVTTTSVDAVFATKGISFNGSQISNSNALKLSVYDVAGKRMLTASTNVSTASLNKGVYLVKAEGVDGTLKIIK